MAASHCTQISQPPVQCRECGRKALWLIEHRRYCNYHFERHMAAEEPFVTSVHRLSENDEDFKWSIWRAKKAKT